MNTDAITNVERACAELIANQQPVTFTQVATRTGLGRTTLYRNPSLRALIEEHRRHALRAGTLSGLADDIATLQTAIEAIANRVRRHEEQLRQIVKQRH
jgi:nicotinamidase-related amidase